LEDYLTESDREDFMEDYNLDETGKVAKVKKTKPEPVEEAEPRTQEIKFLVNLPKDWMKTADKLESKEERHAEVLIKRENHLVYFLFDFLTYLEAGKYVDLKNRFFHEQNYKKIITAMAVSDHPQSIQAEIVQALQFTEIEAHELQEIAKALIAYNKQMKKDNAEHYEQSVS